MLKFVSILSPIVKEFIFDRKLEAKKNNYRKPRAWAYSFIMVLIFSSFFSWGKLVSVSLKAMEVDEENTKLKIELKDTKASLIALSLRCQ